jgi:hypothetical protein
VAALVLRRIDRLGALARPVLDAAAGAVAPRPEPDDAGEWPVKPLRFTKN